ncbi:MAG: hypothetical protein KBG30_10835 [Bacteroidales bacterium]|nr:hypothetical protein [Bacteroidales bacterium]
MENKALEKLIIKTVFDYFGVVEGENKKRKREHVICRQVSMKILNEDLKYSTTQAGLPFGKDHATVLHAKKTINNLMETDKKFRYDYQILHSRIDVILDGFKSDVEKRKKYYNSLQKPDLIEICMQYEKLLEDKESQIQQLEYKMNCYLNSTV